MQIIVVVVAIAPVLWVSVEGLSLEIATWSGERSRPRSREQKKEKKRQFLDIMVLWMMQNFA